MKHLLIILVKGYRFFISPYFPTSCRYYPTCSQYAIDALKLHGVIKGTALAVWRILRCNPWSDGGEDPVPLPKNQHTCTCVSHGQTKSSIKPAETLNLQQIKNKTKSSVSDFHALQRNKKPSNKKVSALTPHC